MPTVGAIMSLITLRLQRLPRVNDAGLQHLVRLTCLRSLDLSYTSVSNTGMSYLASLTSLTELALIGNDRISDLGLEHLQELPLIIVDLALTSVCTRGGLQLLNHCLQLDLIGMTALRGTRKEMFHHLTAVVDLTDSSGSISIAFNFNHISYQCRGRALGCLTPSRATTSGTLPLRTLELAYCDTDSGLVSSHY
jgi:hypothetical protein